MNNTLRHIAYDIQSDLKQVGDDREVTLPKIVFYILMIANRLKSQHIDKHDSGAFLHSYPDLPIIRPTNNSTKNLIKGRAYIFLPKSIYDLEQDRGVEYVNYSIDEDCRQAFDGVSFTRTFAGRPAERLSKSQYEKPSPKNPYWYRVGDYLGIIGIENTNAKFLEAGIYSTFDPITTIDVDQPFDFPEELLSVLKRQVLDLGRFVLMVPSERINDGSNDVSNGNIPTNKLVSVNEQNGGQPQQPQQ